MVVGITGGVGCGKSTVMDIIEQLSGAKILKADEVGHMVMEKGNVAYDAICRHFGKEILCKDDTIDRGKLAAVVYADGEKLDTLNAIVHPCVKDYIQKKLVEWQMEPLILIETAILFESGCDTYCDEIWGIQTDRKIRIQRLMESRGYTEKRAEAIMNRQMSDEELKNRCTRIIMNDGDIEALRKSADRCLSAIKFRTDM